MLQQLWVVVCLWGRRSNQQLYGDGCRSCKYMLRMRRPNKEQLLLHRSNWTSQSETNCVCQFKLQFFFWPPQQVIFSPNPSILLRHLSQHPPLSPIPASSSVTPTDLLHCCNLLCTLPLLLLLLLLLLSVIHMVLLINHTAVTYLLSSKH